MDRHQDFLEEETGEQNQPLIELLHDVYKPSKRDKASLAWMRTRLLTGDSRLTNIQHNTVYKGKTFSHLSDQKTPYERYGSMNSLSSSRKSSQKRLWKHPLTALAALLTIALILGTLAITLNSRSVATTKPTPKISSAVPTKPAPATFTSTPQHTPVNLLGLSMINSTIGWAICQDGSLLRTTNGGRNWVDVTPPSLLTLKQHHVPGASLFPDGSTAWMVVEVWISNDVPNNRGYSLVFHTNDAGKTWRESTLPGTDFLNPFYLNSSYILNPSYSIAAISPQEAWILDTNTNEPWGSISRGVKGLYHTSNGGKTWLQLQNQPPIAESEYPPAISFASPKLGMIVGNVPTMQTTFTITLSLTQDGGKTWHLVSIPRPDPAHWGLQGLYAPQFLTPDDGLFIGEFQGVATSQQTAFMVFRTHDGGQTWTHGPMVAIDIFANTAQFFDSQHGYVLAPGKATGSQRVYKTTDGGQHWNSVALNSNEEFFDLIEFVSSNRGWALFSRELYTTADGGKSWTQIHAHFPSFVVAQ